MHFCCIRCSETATEILDRRNTMFQTKKKKLSRSFEIAKTKNEKSDFFMWTKCSGAIERTDHLIINDYQRHGNSKR